MLEDEPVSLDSDLGSGMVHLHQCHQDGAKIVSAPNANQDGLLSHGDTGGLSPPR